MTTLRQRMIEDTQVRRFSPRTQSTYVQQVALFARHFHQTPQALGPRAIRAYQLYLTNDKKLATSSSLTARSALRFLYKITLQRAWRWEDCIPLPKKPQPLPIVLQSKRSAALSGLRARPEASHDPDQLLGGGLAPLRSPPAQGHRHRQ